MLLFGLNDAIAIAIDDIRITRGAPHVDTSLQNELKQAVPESAEAIAGARSLRLDTRGRSSEWNEIAFFGDKVNAVGDESRDGTEIDIVETPWRKEDKISNGLHWDGYGDHHKTAGHVTTIPGINEGQQHTYGLDWSPDGYIFFVGGVETWRSDAGGVCRNPLFPMLSDECVKNGWCGDPDKAADLPDHTYFDHVRVWQGDSPE
jgi:hypothetical protein